MRAAALAALLSACLLDGPAPPRLTVAEPLTAQVGTPLTVRATVTEEDGTPVSGVAVTAVPGNGTVARAAATTDATGVVTFVWTLGTTAGPQVLELTAGGIGATATALATPGPVAVAGFTQARLVVRLTGRPVPLPFTAKDVYGNPIADPQIRSSIHGAFPQVIDGRWIGTTPGFARFWFPLHPGDTLEVVAHPPVGAYRAAFTRGDTAWSETGRFAPGALAGTRCPGESPTHLAVAYDAYAVTQMRTWPGGGDTVHVARRPRALVHAVFPDSTVANVRVWYAPAGWEGCARATFVQPWSFAIFARLGQRLEITP